MGATRAVPKHEDALAKAPNAHAYTSFVRLWLERRKDWSVEEEEAEEEEEEEGERYP